MAIHTVQVERKLFTVSEYEQMIRAGVLAEDARLELIEGELITMSSIGAAHAGFVKRLNRLLSARVGTQAIVAVQDPIRLEHSEPQPDLALLRPRQDDYINSLPEAGDVLLIIEVADTSVEYDRSVKLPLYARAGVPEAWLLDLNRRVIEVHRQPSEAGYDEKRTLGPGEHIAVPGIASVALGVDDVLGTP